MKTLTPHSFTRLCKAEHYRHFHFLDENQPLESTFDRCKHTLDFNTMNVRSVSPDNMTVALGCKAGQMTFDRVQRIEATRHLSGTVLTLYCTPTRTDGADVRYIILASKSNTRKGA